MSAERTPTESTSSLVTHPSRAQSGTLASGNLDPLRGRRRPGRVSISRGLSFYISPFRSSPLFTPFVCFSVDGLSVDYLLICYPPAPKGSPDRVATFPLFFDLFSASIFYRLLTFFGSLLDSIFDDFPCSWHHFFAHGFCIDFPSIL